MKVKQLLLLIVACFVLAAVIPGFAGATGSAGFVTYQSQADFQQYYSQSDLSAYWPVLTDKDDCRARQDILLSIAPAGCQPAVVRSDLLAEQNVPVFCQIDALQINPLIDINQIRNIRFGGKYPSSVVGTGFHPARAALRTRDMLLGSPLVNNVGYVVIVLKKTPNEKEMPDSVTVELSAQIDYEAGNSLGVGRAEFVLEPTTDEEWAVLKDKQGFWNGKYFVRVNQVDENYASVSVYFGDAIISTVQIKKGEVSREIYFPGSYCMAAVQIAYDGMEASKPRAILEVSGSEGSDVVDVYRGSRFLNDRCSVLEVNANPNGQTGNATLSCGLSKRIFLELSPFATDKPMLSDKMYGQDIEEAFKNALDGYLKVANDYPNERSREVSDSVVPYGEQALYDAIMLSRQFSKYKTMEGLLNTIIQKYPDSKSLNVYRSMLAEVYQRDMANSAAVVDINGRYSTISLKGFRLPVGGEKPYVNLYWNNEMLKVEENGAAFSSDRGTVTLKRIISLNEAEVVVQCDRYNTKETPQTVYLRTGSDATRVCSGGRVSLRLESVEAKEAAKIRVLPKAIGTETETNLTVKIGIEKRAIKLSTDKTKDMISNINESIQKWESISKRLEKVVTGLKSTCLATAAALTVKNFISGASGEAIARQQAMNGPNGWKEKCADMVAAKTKGYTTMTQCFSGEADTINKQIDDGAAAMDSVNGRIVAAEGQPGVTSGSLVSGKSVDEQAAIKAYYSQLKSAYGAEELKKYGIGDPSSYTNGNIPYSYSDMKDVDYALQMQKKGYSFAGEDLKSKADKIAETERLYKQVEQTRTTFNAQTAHVGVGGVARPAIGTILPLKADSVTANVIVGSTSISAGEAADEINKMSGVDAAMFVSGSAKVGEPSKSYLVVGNKDGKVLNPVAVYEYVGAAGGTGQLGVKGDARTLMSQYGISSFEDAGAPLHGNRIRDADRVVRYFGTGPDKNLANIVPFDLNNGWYVRVESLIGVGNNIKAYDSSGLPKSWRICNVGGNEAIDSNDACDLYIDGSADRPILGQDSALSSKLIRNSRDAIRQANNQYGNKFATILDQGKIQVGAPSSPMTATQCQEVMSITDCNILFNVCDPVICPATRCDFGGEYPVSDVIQTGIVGSALLCLPNFGSPSEGGVLIPVCLTGIQAGIDSWVSILKNHRDCLQESLDSGRLVGICDQMTALYTCDFFWKQVAPIANMLVPKLINLAVTGGRGEVRGGGEYQNTLASWNNAQSSVDYITQTYAVNSFKAFQARSIDEVGSEFCKARISGKGPTALKSLAEPESPPQFTASFQAMKYSDATVPATSQYKVFYHIYAGKNAGSYYSVYLKNPPNSPYYSQSSTIQVATGFVRQGDYASETKDFTAPEGYQELCVRINADEECGFQQVSTSFAVNYVTDKFVSNEIKAGGITTESGCISGSPNLGAALVNPTNLQAGAQEAVFPQISNRGIVRICSTINPGQSTSPSRYVEVGYCGDKNTKCWLDKNSVENAISDNNVGLKTDTLKQLEYTNAALLSGNGQVISDNATVVEEIKRLGEIKNKLDYGDSFKVTDLIGRIDNFAGMVIYNHHKAALLMLKAQVFEGVVRNLIKPAPAATVAGSEKAGPLTDEEILVESLDTGQGSAGYVQAGKQAPPLADLAIAYEATICLTSDWSIDPINPNPSNSFVKGDCLLWEKNLSQGQWELKQVKAAGTDIFKPYSYVPLGLSSQTLIENFDADSWEVKGAQPLNAKQSNLPALTLGRLANYKILEVSEGKPPYKFEFSDESSRLIIQNYFGIRYADDALNKAQAENGVLSFYGTSVRITDTPLPKFRITVSDSSISVQSVTKEFTLQINPPSG